VKARRTAAIRPIDRIVCWLWPEGWVGLGWGGQSETCMLVEVAAGVVSRRTFFVAAAMRARPCGRSTLQVARRRENLSRRS